MLNKSQTFNLVCMHKALLSTQKDSITALYNFFSKVFTPITLTWLQFRIIKKMYVSGVWQEAVPWRESTHELGDFVNFFINQENPNEIKNLHKTSNWDSTQDLHAPRHQ